MLVEFNTYIGIIRSWHKSLLGKEMKAAGEEAFTTLIKNKIKIFLKHKKIQNGAVAKPYMRKGFLIY